MVRCYMAVICFYGDMMIPVRKIWLADGKELHKNHLSPLFSDSFCGYFQDFFTHVQQHIPQPLWADIAVKFCYQLNIFVKHLLNLGILHPRRSVRDAAESAQRKCQWKNVKILFAQHSVTIIWLLAQHSIKLQQGWHQWGVGGCSSPKFLLVPGRLLNVHAPSIYNP